MLERLSSAVMSSVDAAMHLCILAGFPDIREVAQLRPKVELRNIDFGAEDRLEEFEYTKNDRQA